MTSRARKSGTGQHAERRDADALWPLASTRNKPRVKLVAARNVVYVVDDDAGMLKGIERLLKANGFDAEVFDSAEAFHDRANPCNGICVVLDVQLGGMSGIELSRQLSQRGSLLPVIFITANDNDTTRKATRDVGCVAYLPKPFPAKSLIDAIERASAQRHSLN